MSKSTRSRKFILWSWVLLPVVSVAVLSDLPHGALHALAAAGNFMARDEQRSESFNADVGDAAHLQRHAILRLVREHRRATDENWRQLLTDAIYNESVSAGVDPLMIAAIVAKESSFRSRAISRTGAVGLMQLRPFVARDVARRTGLEWQGLETLKDPETNVRLGILYYRELVDRFDGDVHLALAAYNRGPSRVSRQLGRGALIASRYADSILGLYRELSADVS